MWLRMGRHTITRLSMTGVLLTLLGHCLIVCVERLGNDFVVTLLILIY